MKGEAARQKQARGWAHYDDATITLLPHLQQRTGSGGYTLVPQEARPPQVWGVARMSGDSVSPTQDGTVRAVVLTLVGPVGALVDVHDTFTLDGILMQVTGVRLTPDGVYAEAVHHGG